MAGRFAPSPSGPLHLGNLRTALVAWLVARHCGVPFYVRIEDLDPATSSVEYERQQLADLAALGLDWDQPVLRQSERFPIYREVIEALNAAGLVYPCFCTRREIREQIEQASRAPQADVDLMPELAYPGTCRDLVADDRTDRTAKRAPALRLRTDGQIVSVPDHCAGVAVGGVDDLVLARADQLPAYNLAVVVDDHLQGVTQVVRGDDLLSSTPRQLLLYELLGWDQPEYWHIPLVMDGEVRLAKRNGGVTLAELVAHGWTVEEVLGTLAASLNLATDGEHVTLSELLDRFDPAAIPHHTPDIADLTAR